MGFLISSLEVLPRRTAFSYRDGIVFATNEGLGSFESVSTQHHEAGEAARSSGA